MNGASAIGITILVQTLDEPRAIGNRVIIRMGRDSLDETAQSRIQALVALALSHQSSLDGIRLNAIGAVSLIGIVLGSTVIADVDKAQQGNDAPHHRRVIEQQ